MINMLAHDFLILPENTSKWVCPTLACKGHPAFYYNLFEFVFVSKEFIVMGWKVENSENLLP